MTSEAQDMHNNMFMLPGDLNAYVNELLMFYFVFFLKKMKNPKNKTQTSKNEPHVQNHSTKILAMPKSDFSI